MLCISGLLLLRGYEQYRERAEIVSRNTNRLVSQSIAAEIDRIDMLLATVADEVATRADLSAGPQLDTFLARQYKVMPMLELLAVADKHGDLISLASHAPAAQVNIQDRNYFAALRSTPGRGLRISRPVLGRISGKWVVTFARRLDDRGGAFDGIVLATLPIDWLAGKIDELDMGPHGVVVIRGDASRNFDILARAPRLDMVGQTQVSATLRAVIEASPEGGSYEAYAGGDHVLRTFSYQRIGAYPLITLVGLAPQDYASGWSRDVAAFAIVDAMFCISSLLAGRAIVRSWHSLEKKSRELALSNARLDHVAHHDALTGLPNRLLLLTLLQYAIERAHRTGAKGALLFVDLDYFKNVNDSFGHSVGDELLQIAARRFESRLRDTDSLYRLGGDEFVVILENLPMPEHAAAVAQSLIEELHEPFALSTACEVYLGASVGICVFPDDGEDAGRLIGNADAAMYQAKKGGRNAFRFYTEELTQAANARIELESSLRRALVRGEFLLHYQPLVSMADMRIVGVEALVRWNRPGEGLVSPQRFIPLAEETGLIVPLGAFVLRTACQQMVAWLDAGVDLDTVAVNLSAHQFKLSNLNETVRAVLQETGLAAHHLELEITESGLMEFGGEAEAKLRSLKSLGVRLAIDDFGTGYSSLAYLRRFPIDKLKVDRSFVHDIPEDPTAMEIASAVVAMAKNLNLDVLAEGVETEAQLAFLRGLNCKMGQGYLFGRPLPPSEVRLPACRDVGTSRDLRADHPVEC